MTVFMTKILRKKKMFHVFWGKVEKKIPNISTESNAVDINVQYICITRS